MVGNEFSCGYLHAARPMRVADCDVGLMKSEECSTAGIVNDMACGAVSYCALGKFRALTIRMGKVLLRLIAHLECGNALYQ